MERYICRTTTELPGYMQANFMVPEGTQMHTGDIYVAETLNENLGYGNWTVYNPDTISDIKDYRKVFELIKKLQEDIYTDTMYPNALRPEENQGYRTKYNGLN